MRAIFLLLFSHFLAISALSGQNYYTVKFPDDQTVYGCGATPPVVNPIITQTGSCGFNVGVSRKDEVFYTNGYGSGCSKILRTWKLIWWCDYNPNIYTPFYVYNPLDTDLGPTVVGNVSNHGYLQYTQIIKIVDNVPPVFLNCPTSLTFCDYTSNDPAQYHIGPVDRCEGPVNLTTKVTDLCAKANVNLSYRLFLDLDQNGSMETLISSASPTAWPIQTTVLNDTLMGSIKFPPGFGLPYGEHKIEWIANDGCGSQSICKYSFIVKDCNPPTLVCINGLSVNIMQTGMITLWATDFLQYAFDNCTPANQIKIAIRKAGTGTGFPTGVTSVTFTCSELGTQPVEIWGQDAYGNASYCQTYLIVQDNSGACAPAPPQMLSLKGELANDQHQKLPKAKVALKSMDPLHPLIINTQSDTAGIYRFLTNQMCSVMVRPKLDTLDKLGVDITDVLLAARHLAGVEMLPNRYRIIAADADADGHITDNDISEIIKVALGMDSVFRATTSWRFVPETFVFTTTDPLLTGAFPDSMLIACGAPTPSNMDFVAIKTGDLNSSSMPLSLHTSATEDRSAQGTRWFNAPEISFQAGETIRVPVQTSDLKNLAGFQFTLGYALDLLDLVRVESGLVTTAQTGIFAKKGTITANWYTLNPATENGQATAFTLVFTARKAGSIRGALAINAAVIDASAYDTQLQQFNVALQFTPVHPAAQALAMFPVRPNPVRDRMTVAFEIAEAGDVTLTLTDVSGKLVQTTKARFEQGYNETTLEVSPVQADGLLFLRIDCAGGSSTQRVVRTH